jgi:hypothetical protein
MRAYEVIRALSESHKGPQIELWGVLSARVIPHGGQPIDHGVIGIKKVTTAFRDYLVDSMQNSTSSPLDLFKFHGCGTGAVAESNTDTTLGGEVGSRVTGNLGEGTAANIFQTVGTHTPGGSHAITEHGVFSATASGTLLDRSVFAAINVGAADSIEFTYQLTVNAEA